MPILLSATRDIFAPLDIQLLYRVLPKVNAYTILPRMVSQNNTLIPP